MQSCLDGDVRFSDFAFDIRGKEVMAMWHWFCVAYPPRERPIAVPEFNVVEESGDIVLTKYRVSYGSGEDQRPVDYFIKSRFTLKNDKIVEQHDEFSNVSEFAFAKMAFGFPTQLLAVTPLLRVIVRKRALEKLKQFAREVES
jgi:hypothetical protein